MAKSDSSATAKEGTFINHNAVSHKKESGEHSHDKEQTKDTKTTTSASSTVIRMSVQSSIVAQDRIESLLECDYRVTTYDPTSFLLVFRLGGRNIKMILLPLLGLLIWDVVWACLFDYVPELESFQRHVRDWEDLTSPLLVPVSFLLVFRLGRAAVRFWDARTAMGKIVEVSRTLMSTASVGCTFLQSQGPSSRYSSSTKTTADENDNELKENSSTQQQQQQQQILLVEEFARWTCVLPIAVKNFLRPEQRKGWSAQQRLAKKRFEIGKLLSDADAEEVLNEDPDVFGPILVLNRLRELAFQASAPSAPAFAPNQQSETSPLSISQHGIIVQQQHHYQGMMLYRQLNEQIDTLTGAWGAMERINSTPLPFVYVVHLRTFLCLYLLIWNLQYVAANGWMAITPLFAGSWGLLGIEAAAVECERPFRWHSNHLRLGNMCVTVAKNVYQTLQNITEKRINSSTRSEML